MHFVVCVDGTEGSDRALEHAADLARAADGRLTVVHAVDPQVYEQAGGGPIGGRPDANQHFLIEAVEDAEERGEAVLEDAIAAVGDVPTDDALLYGAPVAAITAYVDDRDDVDGIVVGHQDVSDRVERVIGSVAKGLVERAPVPVTVVRGD